MKRELRIVIGLAMIVAGGYLVLSPLRVAAVLDRPHETSSQMINLRASWGGTLAGLGAFLAWLPALRPWLRSVLGLAMWAMAGIGVARTVGFILDGEPDTRQYIWITAEAAIVIGCAIGLRASYSRR